MTRRYFYLYGHTCVPRGDNFYESKRREKRETERERERDAKPSRVGRARAFSYALQTAQSFYVCNKLCRFCYENLPNKANDCDKIKRITVCFRELKSKRKFTSQTRKKADIFVRKRALLFL